MKKLLPLLIILLTLSACNFPVQEGDLSQDPVVQTNVASILTQAALTTTEATVEFPIATETQAAEESPEATEEPVQTEEIEEPTAVPTEPPTEAPVPTATEVPTEAPTATALPTATPVPTETTAPTQSSGDDPWSGEPDLLEDFTYGTYWDFENDQFLSKVANGQLEFVSKGTPWWSSWYTTYPEYEDGYFETTFAMPKCTGQDRFGLVIRWTEDNGYYYMGITCDGTWGFSQYTADNKTNDLLAYQSTTALNPPAETNRIGIQADDNEFEFYINEQKVGTFTHDELDEAGTFGFITRAASTQVFQTLIEKLEYWAD
ncbi:MAG TPA: hypothetical protein GX730_05630 [Chloroflexi bacterium]|nr:hypothetical protein [Chloroflexota bacterium]